MIINTKNITMVRPTEEMPRRCLWLSNLDLLFPVFHRSARIFFYKSNGPSDFFSPNPMKEALGKALVLFYPLAGRLKKDPDGRLEIDCNGHGVLFVQAETSSLLDDFVSSSSNSEFKKLVPTIDYSGDFSSSPLCAIQVTYFKCGGASVGVAVNHIVADGPSNTHFINTWAKIGRGLDPGLPPIHDRTLLGCRDPPQPKFEHTEYEPIPKHIKNHYDLPQDITTGIFRLTGDQINALKAKYKQGVQDIAYTTNDILAGHIWRSACLAKGLAGQSTTLKIVADGRPRMKEPALPPGYYGNATFAVDVEDEAGDLLVKPSWYAATRVHNGVARLDSEYVRSSIDFLELHPSLLRPSKFHLTSWRWLPVSDVDFGWGKPIFMGPPSFPVPGVATILPCLVNDGSICFVMSFEVKDMKLFETYFYDI